MIQPQKRMKQQATFASNQHQNSPETKRQARAIHLVHVTSSSGKPTFTLTGPGEAFLRSIPGPFATIVIVGPYRSGKSFLSNALIRSAGISAVKQDDQFKVAGTQRACTYGLWISTVPIECVDPKTGKLFNAYVVDVEGFDSTAANAEHDALLFAMSMFFSSFLVLNAQRTITQSSMSNLAMVVDLCKHIQFSSGGSALEDARSLGETFTPELLVVIRDFCLDLVDADGNAITADDYLDEALSPPAKAPAPDEQTVSSKSPEVFDLLKAYFPKNKRHCMTMAKPCIKDTDLKRANTMPLSSLSGAFQRGLGAFVTKIKKGGIPVKTIYGDSPIDGAQFADMFGMFLTSLNSGTTPVVQDVWAGMAQGQCTKVARTCLESFRSQAASLVASGGSAEASTKLAERMRQALDKFDAQSCGPAALKASFRETLLDDLGREMKVAQAKMDRVLRDKLTQTILQFWPDHSDDPSQLTPAFVGKFCSSVLASGKTLTGNKTWLYDLLLTHSRQWLGQMVTLSQAALQKSQASLSSVTQMHQELQEECATAAKSLEDSSTAARDLTAELDQLRQDHKTATETTRNLESALKAAADEHAVRFETQQTEIKSLRAKAKEIFTMAKQSAELQQLCSEYATSLQTAKADLDRVVRSKQDQETQFAESLQAMEEATTETVREVRTQLARAVDAKNQAVAREQELSAMSSTLVQQLEAAKGSLAAMETETKTLSTSLAEMRRTSSLATSNHAAAIQRLEMQVAAADESLVKKNDEIKALSEQAQKMDKEFYAVQIQMVKLEAERDHLIRELQSEKEKVKSAASGQTSPSSIADSKLEQMKQRLLALRTQNN